MSKSTISSISWLSNLDDSYKKICTQSCISENKQLTVLTYLHLTLGVLESPGQQHTFKLSFKAGCKKLKQNNSGKNVIQHIQGVQNLIWVKLA